MNSQYKAPNKDLSFYTCPHCKTVSQMDSERNVFGEGDDGYIQYETDNILYIHKCTNCGKKIIWCDDEYIYPETNAITANPDMPLSVMSLFNEAGLIISKSPRAACALLRLAIEKLCSELGADEGSIDKNIAKLVRDGLPHRIQQSLDIVRVVGNKAVHPGQIDLNVDDRTTAEQLMKLINIIVERTISEDKTINCLYESLPQNIKESIQKRDNK